MNTKRVLSFVVEGQNIKKDEFCDFTGLVSGTKGYYTAKFRFDKTWDDYKKIVVFRNREVTKYVPLTELACDIPDEIVDAMTFYVSVIGILGDVSLPTTEVFVKQKRGGVNVR